MTAANTNLGNSPVSYGAVTKAFHWATALLILTNLPLGVVAENWPADSSADLATKAWLFSLHKTTGITILFVALARIAWAVTQPKPGLLNAHRRWESRLAETVHWVLYASLVLVPLSGWIHHAASTGFAPIWWPFGQSLPLVPKSEPVSAFFSAWHWVFTKILLAAVALHIAGALKHHLVDGDATLRRMLPGRTAPDLPAQSHDRAPVIAAAIVWAVAIGAGSALGLGSAPATAVQAPQLAAEPSEWTVEAGRLGIAVTQLGSTVEGSFADWSASIAFDPDGPDAEKGQVTVEIAIPSLTLGSVTSEALKPEFFAADEHPTARFDAAIRAAEDAAAGYVAEGTLRLKGTEAPVSLPFDLQIDGDRAEMQGRTTLDRRTFGIGTQSYDDESTVAFPVEVRVELTASRSGADDTAE